MVTDCATAIQDALLALDRQDSMSWCVPLVDVLESHCAGSSVGWCAGVLRETSTGSHDASEIDVRCCWITELQSLVRSGADAIDVERRSRAIWYHGHERDHVQTAIAKAYEAVAAYLNGDVAHYRRGIALTISHVALAGVESSTDKSVQRAIELFRRLCERLQETPTMEPQNG